MTSEAASGPVLGVCLLLGSEGWGYGSCSHCFRCHRASVPTAGRRTLNSTTFSYTHLYVYSHISMALFANREKTKQTKQKQPIIRKMPFTSVLLSIICLTVIFYWLKLMCILNTFTNKNRNCLPSCLPASLASFLFFFFPGL